jgi:hypothetical protein
MLDKNQTVRAELVEAPPFSFGHEAEKNGPSTSSGRTGFGKMGEQE